MTIEEYRFIEMWVDKRKDYIIEMRGDLKSFIEKYKKDLPDLKFTDPVQTLIAIATCDKIPDNDKYRYVFSCLQEHNLFVLDLYFDSLMSDVRNKLCPAFYTEYA